MTLYYFVFRDDVLVACFSMRLYCLERDFHDDSMRLAGVFSMKLYCYLTLGRFVRGDQPEAMNGEYVYYYGLHGANDRKIKITLKPEPLEREFAKQ